MPIRILATLLGTTLFLCTVAAAKQPKPVEAGVRFPKGYRQWTHTKSMVIFSDKHPLFNAFSGIHHIYMNEAAMKAIKTHGPYTDGSVIVFDLLEAGESDGAYTEGSHKLLAVMQKDGKQFKDTGGWGFQGFKAGDSSQRVVTDPVAQCFNCHASQKERDFVYSEYTE